MSAPFSVENARERAELCADRAREGREHYARLFEGATFERDDAKRTRMLQYVAVCKLRAETDERCAALYLEAAEKT